MANSKIDKERVRELLALIIAERGKTQRREHVAALYELLRPILKDKPCISSKPGRVGINEPAPQADLHVVGVVSRVEESLYDYGNVYGGEGGLVEGLLHFEGKRVEIMVTVLEDNGG